MDFGRASKETVDPTYLWIGPNEKALTGNNRISVTNTGQLMVKDFLEALSGLYTCTLSYKTIKAETQEETIIKKRYDFMIFAYREPDYSYQMALRFTTKSCIGRFNDLLFRVLKKILDNLISDLSCHVIEPSYKCHLVKVPDRGLINELFIAFQVNPFAPGWKTACNVSVDCEDITNHNILQARDRIEEFFRSQANILSHHINRSVPAMHFVDHSFQVVRMDSCRPGFGKNEGLHSNCASCCVVCSPGTFSPDVDVTCQICISVHSYGAKSCP
ncbi:PREDICTED: zona pellucida-binding protein 2 isoform X1 [Dipodomys ordii]|uniref:Zona pellucida-binding protein 2 isoform X1 n=2 Tax=Dipodomys TaxID=10016 RepID=A0A1S3GYB7_DIPOR|nr:PREDICTED: zona pellucida-binding protein 2 isoform X1 [Dipodomys ordii]XP_042529619.1 zona pellucida-binding protein 2 isoform X3 [Dipodomys spectabilis]XP_042529620.1 zona pellucida-binding protein 2 isoform X3 [Dipodomys spectabilis]